MVENRYEMMLESGELNGTVVDVPEVLERIREIWGDLDDERGAYCNRNWLSVADVVRVIVESAYPADY